MAKIKMPREWVEELEQKIINNLSIEKERDSNYTMWINLVYKGKVISSVRQ